jgi:hypothetical protein
LTPLRPMDSVLIIISHDGRCLDREVPLCEPSQMGGFFMPPPSSDRTSGSSSLTVLTPAAMAAPCERLDPIRPYRTPGDGIVRPSEHRSIAARRTRSHPLIRPSPGRRPSRMSRAGWSGAAIRRCGESAATSEMASCGCGATSPLITSSRSPWRGLPRSRASGRSSTRSRSGGRPPMIKRTGGTPGRDETGPAPVRSVQGNDPPRSHGEPGSEHLCRV